MLLLLGSPLVGSLAQAQPREPQPAMESECVLWLREGIKIRAQVLEYVPGSHVILRAYDGQTFRLPIEEVESIEHPGNGPLPPSPACLRRPRVVRPAPPPVYVEPATPPPQDKVAPVQPSAPEQPAVTAPATGPVVNLLSDRPGAELERAIGSTKVTTRGRNRQTYTHWEYQWAPLCPAPCGVRLPAEGVYRVGGGPFRWSAPFQLTDFSSGPFNLRLRMGPQATYYGGVTSVVLGILSGLAGAGLLISGALSSPMTPPVGVTPADLASYQGDVGAQRTQLAVGGVLLGTGIVGIIGGWFLLRRGETRVNIERPSAPVEPSEPQPETGPAVK